jgi:hypothetical protein
MASESTTPDDERSIEEILTELRQLRFVVDRMERRRRRMVAALLVVFLVMTPALIVGGHLLVDYESGRVAHTIEQASGPFTDEALRRACQSIQIPIFGPETKKRLHCAQAGTTPTTTTTTPPPAPTETAVPGAP